MSQADCRAPVRTRPYCQTTGRFPDAGLRPERITEANYRETDHNCLGPHANACTVSESSAHLQPCTLDGVA
ncbi:MAG: hypothetical protein OXF78_12760, partial [Rhodospirillales bacterium]|nr:hypothetical protein [Rhodospirillales bacterium]